jgi:hypothetical protein
MKTTTIKLMMACLMAGLAWNALLAAGAPGSKEIKLPRSHIESVDLANMTFTVIMSATNLTVHITSETRFFLGDKPAIFKDVEVADHVRGTLRRPAGGQPEAVRIYIEKLAPK